MNRRIHFVLLESSREFLEEASSQAEVDMAISFNDKALDEIYRHALPGQKRHG